MLQISSNIRLIRQLSGQNQTDFGKPFDATKAMIVSYEKGKAKPTGLFIERLSRYTGVDVERLTNQKLSEGDIDRQKLEKLFNVENVNRGTLDPKATLRIPIISDGSAETDYLKVILALAKSNDNLVEQNKTVVDTNQTIAIANAKLADQLAKEQQHRLSPVNSETQDQTPALSLQQIHEEIQELALSVRNVEQKMSSIYPAGKDSTYKEFEQDMKKFQKQKANKGSESGKSR